MRFHYYFRLFSMVLSLKSLLLTAISAQKHGLLDPIWGLVACVCSVVASPDSR